MTRMHARSKKGERSVSQRIKNRGSNISLIGAIQLSGLAALYPYDGAIDGDRFLSFLDEHLIGALKPGDVVVMDNLRVHHMKEVEAKLEENQIKALFLPPYSPELNPIEEIWSVMKRVFRTLEARTITQLVEAIIVARDSLSNNIIKGVLKNAGYARS